MNTTIPQPVPFLQRKVAGRITITHLLLAGIILLSAGLHFWDIGSIGNSNQYYTAAVESMTQSWHNFFFNAAEPGGSVTVDKPPLGLWIETLFALVLGVSGFSTSLPNILAGILSVPLMYHLVRKYLGTGAGLVAALVMAVTPVVFATDRNNTADGMLTFILLLAAWAFITAVEKGKLIHVLLGALLVGLGFNIKMLQAFLPLPAFYAFYFFASKNGWWKKILHLFLAAIVLVVVSLSWALAVDLTPADERPYIGSSSDNTVMSLIIGYNGLQRLLGGEWKTLTAQGGDQPALNQAPPQGQVLPPVDDQPAQDAAGLPPRFYPTPGDDAPNAPVQAQQGGAGAMFSQETGTPGILRFFQVPLAKEMSWLLPFALAGLVIALFVIRPRLPLEAGIHKAWILWGGWLLNCMVFFSTAKFFHAYYMILLVPGLAGAVAIGFAAFKEMRRTRPALAGILFLLATLLTITFQLYLALSLNTPAWWMLIPVVLAAGGAALLFAGMASPTPADPALSRSGLPRSARILLLLAMICLLLTWSLLTVQNQRGNGGLVSAYAGNRLPEDARDVSVIRDQNLPPGAGYPRPGQAPGAFRPPYGNPPYNPPAYANPGAANPAPNAANDRLLEFLQENTQEMKYLVAVPSSQVGASLVIRTGRPVLYMGGFSGNDPVVDVPDLVELTSSGDLRYILYGGGNRPQNHRIQVWLEKTCRAVPGFNQGGNANNAEGMRLFDCGRK